MEKTRKRFLSEVTVGVLLMLFGWFGHIAYQKTLARSEIIKGVHAGWGGVIGAPTKDVTVRVTMERPGLYDFIVWADDQPKEILKMENIDGQIYFVSVVVPADTQRVAVGVRGSFWLERRSRIEFPMPK